MFSSVKLVIWDYNKRVALQEKWRKEHFECSQFHINLLYRNKMKYDLFIYLFSFVVQEKKRFIWIEFTSSEILL